MISGIYSSDRLRGARPMALLADWLLLVVRYLPVVFPEFVKLLDRL